jgi:SH3 domain protein
MDFSKAFRRVPMKPKKLGSYGTLISLAVLPILCSGAETKTLYVSSYREVDVLTGPSQEYRTMATLKTGDEVSLIDATGGYYLVVMPNGSRGFVSRQHMTEQPPLEAKLRALEEETKKRIAELEDKNLDQAKQLAALSEERSLLESAKVRAEEVAEQQTKVASQLQLQQDGVERDYYIRWFLAGGGVFLVGGFFGWLWGNTVRRGRSNGLRMGRL